MLSTSSFQPLSASMGPMLKEESFHLGTGANGLRRIVKAGVIPISFLQKYINKWVSTGLDLFGTDESTSALWAYVYGVKGRYDERESDQEADREHLNEASRGLYFDELKAEMVRIKGRKDGEPEHTFLRTSSTGALGCIPLVCTLSQERTSMGREDEYRAYLAEVLPSDEDERKLMEEYMAPGVEWIQYREWKA